MRAEWCEEGQRNRSCSAAFSPPAAAGRLNNSAQAAVLLENSLPKSLPNQRLP